MPEHSWQALLTGRSYSEADRKWEGRSSVYIRMTLTASAVSIGSTGRRQRTLYCYDIVIVLTNM